ncbi:MAG: S41 family peptidase [Steroidobacteraceae bacterium]
MNCANRRAALPALLLMLGGCGQDACQQTELKQFIVDRARENYLFPQLLPTNIDVNQYASGEAVLDALTATARAQGLDRNFSSITTISGELNLIEGGATVAFGVQFAQRGPGLRLFIVQVFEGSNAAAAGFRRGDEILAIGETTATLTPVATVLASVDGLNNALGPDEPGVTRIFSVLTAGGATVERSVAKDRLDLNAVPFTQLIAQPGLPPVGYLQLRSFIGTAEAQLRSAFAEFRANSVTDVIVDIRYNGGGLVRIAQLLANLLSAERSTQEVLYRTRLNPLQAASEQTVTFRAEPEAIGAQRIAFLTTASTASASEILINSLYPYVDVAMIGARSFGKPVGQNAFDAPACDLRLRLVAFQTLNRDGTGDYFAGLPDANYTDTFCPVNDDLASDQDSVQDPLTAAGLNWLASGACPAANAQAVDDRPIVSRSLQPDGEGRRIF